MFYKLLRLIPIFALLLLTTQVKAGTNKLSLKNDKQQAGKQFQNSIDTGALAADLITETNFSPQTISKLPITQPGVIFLANNILTDLNGTTLLTGIPCNRVIKPVYLQLLFPFHVFW
jgi:hypothetical protein